MHFKKSHEFNNKHLCRWSWVPHPDRKWMRFARTFSCGQLLTPLVFTLDIISLSTLLFGMCYINESGVSNAPAQSALGRMIALMQVVERNQQLSLHCIFCMHILLYL